MDTIKSVFEASAPDFVVDAKLIARIRQFEREFVNRSEDHISFFGGQLTGVHPMRFRPQEREKWFIEVLDIDDLQAEEGIKRLPHNQDWVRANDVFNLSCVWLTHRIMTSSLAPALKEEGARLTIQILQYKFLGSILSHYFRFPADEGTALATLAQMSKKYLIKTAPSWHALLETRAEDMVSSRSVHRRAYMEMRNDKDVINMVNDIQNRLKELIKSICKIFYELHARGVKVGSERSVREAVDGSVILMDKTRQFTTFIRYLHTVMDDPKSFVREELVDVVADGMHTMDPRRLVETLEWMSKNRQAPRQQYITELADETLIYAFELIASDRELYNSRGGLTPLITKLRSMYMASRMSDPSLLKTKELSEKVVTNAIHTKNASVIASVRTGVQLYLVLRAMAMQYYQS
ncbi:aldehyde dehydrogenase [Xanthomonas phage vB_XciM_LucasX]|nr:aldehyde dehydrogenase [Xanthomonas phage vB_XciM_LucasX]